MATATAAAASTGSELDGRRLRTAWLSSAVLLLGAGYTLLPVVWVVMGATKSGGELFTTFALAPGTGLADNVAQLNAYRDGVYWRWALNTALYAGVGGLLSTFVSAACGFALAKYRFVGRTVLFNLILAGVLVPGVTLAVPQYLLLAEVGLANTYWSVLVPSILSPFGVYLARIYAGAAVSDQLLEAARVDQASEATIFLRIALPVMTPGLVTIFLFQFVAVWNNFLLPFVMLSDDALYPITVGLYTLLNQGSSQPALYNLAITGAFIAIIPIIGLFLVLQRFWSVDLMAGAVKA